MSMDRMTAMRLAQDAVKLTAASFSDAERSWLQVYRPDVLRLLSDAGTDAMVAAASGCCKDLMVNIERIAKYCQFALDMAAAGLVSRPLPPVAAAAEARG